MVDVAHDRDHRRPRLQVLVVLVLAFFVQVDVELLKKFLVLLLGGDDADLPPDLVAQNLEGGLIQGLGGRSHLAQVEEHRDQGSGVDVDLVSQVGQGGALAQLDGTPIACWDAHAADDGCLHLLEFVPLGHPVLAGLGGLASLATECSSSAATTATTTA